MNKTIKVSIIVTTLAFVALGLYRGTKTWLSYKK